MPSCYAVERREKIARILMETNDPVSASALARRFSVSRQIIVGDIALLRAHGVDIAATPRGYILVRSAAPQGVTRKVACVHLSGDMARELESIVDAGGEVMDVVVEHPVYGQLTGELHIRSRYDVDNFLEKVRLHQAKPLSDLTSGVHLHTLRCPDEETMARVVDTLSQGGFLYR